MKILDPGFESSEYQNNLSRFYSDIHLHSPIFTTSEGVIYLSSYDDCQRLLQDNNFVRRPAGSNSAFSLEQKELSLCEAMIDHWMVYQDPPYHTKLRNSFNKIFTPKTINALRPDIHQCAKDLIDTIPVHAPFDFIDSIAFPFPIKVIATFFAIPDIDFDNFKKWSYQLTLSLNTGNPDSFRNADAAIISFKAYFADLFESRKNTPGNDLLSMMIIAFNNNELTYDEIIDTCIFLIWAGHETTKLLISNGLLLLLLHKKQQEYFCSHENCTANMIEEVMRFESPVQKISRWTVAPCEFQGVHIEKNAFITALLGAANRDPKVYSHPEQFILNRKESKHLAFGKGIHHCLGAFLARTEGEIIFDLLRPLLPGIELVDYEWRPASAFRCLEKLIIKIN